MNLFPAEFFAELARHSVRRSHDEGWQVCRHPEFTTLGYELRAWQRGDTRRQVNWRATARSRQVMVRQPEREVGGQLWLLLDRSASLAPQNLDRDIAQRRLALALAWLALEQGASLQILAGEQCLQVEGWSQRDAVRLFLQQLPLPAGRVAFALPSTPLRAGTRLHVLSDPWFCEETWRRDGLLAGRWTQRLWTCLCLPQEHRPPQEPLLVQDVETGQKLNVDLSDTSDFARDWQQFRKAHVLAMQQLGFHYQSLDCLAAAKDAAGILQRAAFHHVL